MFDYNEVDSNTINNINNTSTEVETKTNVKPSKFNRFDSFVYLTVSFAALCLLLFNARAKDNTTLSNFIATTLGASTALSIQKKD